MEGIVLRLDNEESGLEDKYKVVRPDFVRGCEGVHWSSRPIAKQQVDFEFRDEYLAECYPYAINKGSSVTI